MRRHRRCGIAGLTVPPLTRRGYAQAVDALKNSDPIEQLDAEALKKLSARSRLGMSWLPPKFIAPAVIFLAADKARPMSRAAFNVTGSDSATTPPHKMRSGGVKALSEPFAVVLADLGCGC